MSAIGVLLIYIVCKEVSIHNTNKQWWMLVKTLYLVTCITQWAQSGKAEDICFDSGAPKSKHISSPPDLAASW